MKRRPILQKLAGTVLLLSTAGVFAQTTPAPQPSICSRSCWSARAGSCTTSLGSLTRAIIHHTAGPSDYTSDYENGKARMRANQNYHMDSNGWCDIGYHFLVNAGGHIYEGRAGSLGASSGWKRGAHDGCNANSMGFTLLGYFHPPYNHAFTATIQNAISAVIAWRMPSGWSAHGSSTYCSASVGTLDGHYKVKATACPGDVVIPQLGNVRNNVAARRTPYTNPPYLFGSGGQGFVAGNSITGLTWSDCCGWPGIIYGDQTGPDCFIYGPSASFTGMGEGVINVDLYPQNGSSANHDMQVHYKTSAENFWDAAKASPSVSYSAQNAWTTINLYVGGPKWTGQTINQLRLDFDANNQGTRWIVNHIVAQSSLRWHFTSSTMGWIAGNGVAAPWWTDCCGWTGILVVDQTGNDGFIYSTPTYFDTAGPYKFIGGANDRIHVRIYPQNGSTADHDMQVFWKTTADPTWTESKSVSTTYVANNTWADVYLNVGSHGAWRAGKISEIRLDFDQTNHGNRWIIDYIAFEH